MAKELTATVCVNGGKVKYEGSLEFGVTTLFGMIQTDGARQAVLDSLIAIQEQRKEKS